MSNFFKKAIGLTALVALFPYKTKTTPLTDDENGPKDVSLESLVCRLDVNHKINEDGTISDQTDVNFTFHTEGISSLIEKAKKLPDLFKEKSGEIVEKATELKEKAAVVTETVKEKATTISDQVSDFVEDASIQLQAKVSQAKEIITNKVDELKKKDTDSEEMSPDIDSVVEEES